ncbi:hypothetical protein GCK32_021142 [Trichostrongylus colubriformis]|uniref:Uncharacterized protein n=1 Tax=Trichostrongylus colubriformis TaxID=6319 RepID=A0AAN8FXG1_TRICO
MIGERSQMQQAQFAHQAQMMETTPAQRMAQRVPYPSSIEIPTAESYISEFPHDYQQRAFFILNETRSCFPRDPYISSTATSSLLIQLTELAY